MATPITYRWAVTVTRVSANRAPSNHVEKKPGPLVSTPYKAMEMFGVVISVIVATVVGVDIVF
jgi:hypothetical protein